MPKSKAKTSEPIRTGTAAAREFLQERVTRLVDQARQGTLPKPPAAPAPTLDKQTPKTPQIHRLANKWGWLISFTVVAEDQVQVERTYRGADVGSYTMPRCEARRYWSSLRSGGFEPQQGNF